ncbi:MAG: 2OG-Fe(II) oxygenase [Deltaproteobacteria bacterium]|nr:2OG-Fe(II) oxygenase [Deltaproteobacteria bacterium]
MQAASAALDLVIFGVTIRLVDQTDLGLPDSVRATYPDSLAHISSAELAEPVVALVAAAVEGSSEPEYRLTRNGKEIMRGLARDLEFHLRNCIDHAVATRCEPNWLFVHSGVVAWHGQIILIPGRSRTGKSQLVLELVRRGARYYSDEYAVLDSKGLVHPYPRAPFTRTGDVESRVDLDEKPRVSRPALPVSLILSTAYQDKTTWHPRVVSGSRGVLPLIDNAVMARSDKLRTLRVAREVARTSVTLEGPRAEASLPAVGVQKLIADSIVARELGAKSLPLQRFIEKISHDRAHTFTHVRRPEPSVAPKFVRFENFLEPLAYQKVLDFTLSQKDKFNPSEIIGEDGGGKVDPKARISTTIYELEPIWPLFEARLRALLPHVRRELGLPWFSTKSIERQLTAHQSGGHFAPHTDQGDSGPSQSRVLTCVFHFHQAPRSFQGGDLQLYGMKVGSAERAASFTPLVPINNSVIFFASTTYHAVWPVLNTSSEFEHSRFALNIWFHSGDDPFAAQRTKRTEVVAQA